VSSEAESLRTFIKENMGHFDAIAGDQDLLTTGVLDSFNIVEIALFIQEAFGVELDGDDISRNNFSSLDNMITLIQRHKA